MIKNSQKSEKNNPHTHSSGAIKNDFQVPAQNKNKLCTSPELIQRYEGEFLNIKVPNPSDVKQKLLQSGRFQLKFPWAREIRETLISSDYESLHLELHYGNYATKIHVINLKLKYNFITEYVIGKGQFGTVYYCEYNGRKIAIKANKINLEQQPISNAIKKIYKQYFLALLASELEAGPKIINAFGYDILFNCSEAFFCMERCVFKPSELDINQIKNQKNQNLKYSLYSLHLVNVIHRDIKPNNICWSLTFQKYVFIDFGLSIMVEQQKGQKAYCKFAGTYIFSYDEMRRLFFLRLPGFVDLYYNDAFGLSKSLGVQMKDSEESVSEVKDSFFPHFFDILNIKKNLFNQNHEAVFQKIKQMNSMYQSCIQMLNSFVQFAIISNAYQIWKSAVQELQLKVIASKYTATKADRIIAQYFKNSKNENKVNFLIPFKDIFENKIFDLEQILNDKQWIQRFHNIINPTLEGYLTYDQNKGLSSDARYIVNKIYQHLQKKDSNLFAKKLRRVILFISNKFQDFNHIKGLKDVSQMFLVIRDQQNIFRIRELILKRTKDPFTYCFTSLNFFMVSQITRYAEFPTQQKNYLSKIQEIKYEQKIQKTKQLKLIELIATNLQKFEAFKTQICHAQILYKIFQSIYQLILQLEQSLIDSEFQLEMSDIIKIYTKIFLNFLQKSKQNGYKYFFGEEIDLIYSRIQLKRSSITEKEQKAIVNFPTMIPLVKSLTWRIQNTDSLQLLQQIYEFIFDISHGKADRMLDECINCMIQKIKTIPKTLAIILKYRSSWILKTSQQPMSSTQYYKQLRFMFPLALNIYFKRNQLNISQFTEMEKQMEKIIRYYSIRAKKQISDLQELEAISQLVDIIDNMKVYLLKNDEKSMQQISQFSAKITKPRSTQTQFFKFTINRVDFVTVLAWLRNSNLIITKKSRNELDNQILALWEQAGLLIGAIAQDYLLEQLLKIYLARQKIMQAYQLLIKIIETININISLYDNARSIRPLRQAFCQFSQKAPLSILNEIITQFINSTEYSNLLAKRQTVLFLCLMFKKCADQFQVTICERFLKLIAKYISFMDYFGQSLIKQIYYDIFNKKIEVNTRKQLILLRTISRSSIDHSGKKHKKLGKFIRDLSSRMRQRARDYLQSKIEFNK